MPTTPFQCGVFIIKTGETMPTQCDFIVKEHSSQADAQKTYQNHLDVHKLNGTYLTNNFPERKDTTIMDKGSKIKVTSCPKWVKDQSFESFSRDFKDWQKCSDLTSQQEKSFLVEMLKGCERTEVKQYYGKSIMNSKTVKHDVEGIMNKLHERCRSNET